MNIDFSGIIKRVNINIKQNIPPRYSEAQALPENSQ